MGLPRLGEEGWRGVVGGVRLHFHLKTRVTLGQCWVAVAVGGQRRAQGTCVAQQLPSKRCVLII